MDAQVLPVPPGSLIVLHGVTLDPSAQEEFRRALIEVTGHERFAILTLPLSDGPAEVWGPDDDLVARVREHFTAPPPALELEF